MKNSEIVNMFLETVPNAQPQAIDLSDLWQEPLPDNINPAAFELPDDIWD